MRYVRPARIVELVHQALDLGINFFDTAAAYQQSESLLGRAFRSVARERFFVASKVAPVEQGSVITPSALRAQVERSLTRLGVDELDLLQLHRVAPEYYGKSVDRLIPELEKLRKEGKTRFIGITEASSKDPQHEMVMQALRDDYFDTIMVAYSLINPVAAEEILTMAFAKDVGVVAMAAARHLAAHNFLERLTVACRSLAAMAVYPPERNRFAYRMRSAATGLRRNRANPAGPIGAEEEDGTPTLPSAGYTFAVSHPAVATVLTGTTSAFHLEQNVAAVLTPRQPLSS
jgi:L-galactose dehydrogenase